MKERWNVILSTLIVVVILTAIIAPVSIYYWNNTYDPVRAGYIRITSDRDFIRYEFPGSGTIDDPYLIENYVLNSIVDFAIYIESTTKCFVIQNCTLTSIGDAIHLEFISNNGVIVRNNSITDSNIGIRLCSTSNIEIRDNLFLKNRYAGLELDSASNTSIVNNTILYSEFGIYMTRYGNSVNCLFENNTCAYNYAHGIFFEHFTSYCTVKNNVFAYNTLSGVSVSSSYYFTLIDNYFLACGFRTILEFGYDHLTYTIENNSVNNKPLGFFKVIKNENYTEDIYGQLIFVNCTGIRVENHNISYASIAITILYCTNVTIRKNTCNYNVLSGISITASENISLINNTCNFNKGSLIIRESVGIQIFSCAFVQVINNTILNNTYGIFFISYGILIENNTISNNYYGILPYGYTWGITIIKRNYINANYYGIYYSSIDNGLIAYNTFFENVGYAVYINDPNSQENVIHHNNFINNNLAGQDTGFAQAYDDLGSNYWFDELNSEGNFWSDWQGSGSYTLDGSANAADLYPLGSVVIW